MVEAPLFQVDAFTDRLFEGNPAAVCLLPRWPEAGILQAIAAENNLSETAFLVGGGGTYELRWFTPVREVDLCGHATLASAHVLFRHYGFEGSEVAFDTKSGRLTVRREEDRLRMDFPARPAEPVEPPTGLFEALGGAPTEVHMAADLLVRYAAEEEVRALKPVADLLGEPDGPTRGA